MTATLKANSAAQCDRYISPARTSQILGAALGHGYSRQSVLRLLEEGILLGHQMKPRGRWWIVSSSVHAYIAGLQNADAAQIGAIGYSATMSSERPKGQYAIWLPN
jgi:hypothetical protein